MENEEKKEEGAAGEAAPAQPAENKSKRQGGITTLSILFFVFFVPGFISFFVFQPEYSTLFGFQVPLWLAKPVDAVLLIVMFYCALGLWKMKEQARVLSIYLIIWLILDELIALIRHLANADNWESMTSGIAWITGNILGTVICVLVIRYLIRLQASFTGTSLPDTKTAPNIDYTDKKSDGTD